MEMKKKQIKRRLVDNKGEVTLTWIFEDGSRLFSAAEHFSDGHGAQFRIEKSIILKDRGLNVEVSVTKGGKMFTGNCTLEKESIIGLIEILQNHVSTITPFERDDDVVTKL